MANYEKKVAKKAGKKNITAVRKQKGQSNAGKYPRVKDFAGPNNTFPINTMKRARNALSRAHLAASPASVRRKVYAKYPSLNPRKKK